MEVMYISRRFEENICATMHYRAIKQIFGDDHVFTVDLSLKGQKRESNGISFSKPNRIVRMTQMLTGTVRSICKEFIQKILEVICERGIEVVYIDEGYFGVLTRKIKTEYPNVRVVSFYHDISVVMHAERIRMNRFSVRNLGVGFLFEYIATAKGERLNARYADCVLTLNQRDADLFEKCYHRSVDRLLPMGVAEPDLEDTEAKEFSFNRDKTVRYLVFVGTYYEPNLRGLRWFVDEVFNKLPEFYELVVVGRNLEKVRPDYKNERIHIIGGVESLAPYYNNADVVVAPVFGGGGMKQKTAEAFAYGRCLLATIESIQGYEEELKIEHNGHYVVFASDNSEDQVKDLEYLEQNSMYGYNEELHYAYEIKYSKKSLINTLSEVLTVEGA